MTSIIGVENISFPSLVSSLSVNGLARFLAFIIAVSNMTTFLPHGRILNMHRYLDIRNPDLRKGQSPAQLWKGHVQATLKVLQAVGIDTNQYIDQLAKTNEKAA